MQLSNLSIQSSVRIRRDYRWYAHDDQSLAVDSASCPPNKDQDPRTNTIEKVGPN